MKLYEVISIIIILVASLVFGIISKTYDINVFLMFGLISLLFVISYGFSWLYRYLESTRVLTVKKTIFFMGRGIPKEFVQKQVIVLEISILIFTLLTTYQVLVGHRIGFSPVTLIIVGATLAVSAVSFFLVKLRANIIMSFRKTSVEVELPFFLSFIRALSETHISLYDLFNIVEKSASLKAWSKEISFARKMASINNISLIQSLVSLSETHPSPIVRDVFRRIVTVGYVTGTAKEVVERAFKYIQEQLHSRLLRLTEKLDIVNGTVMFGFLFLPIMFSTVAPVIGQSPMEVFALSMIVEGSIVLLMYAFLGHIYPSGFIIITPRPLLIISFASAIISFFFILVYASPILVAALSPTYRIMGRIEPGISEFLLYALVLISLIPAMIYSEIWFRKTRIYTKIVRVVTDSAEVSRSLGTNFISVFERLSFREGKEVQRLARSVVEGYKSDVFRRSVVMKAPSIFYASFIETLLYALLIGASPKVIFTLTKSYEALNEVVERISRVSRTLEGMIIAMSAMLGFFTKYLEVMFSSFNEMIASSKGKFTPSIATGLFRFDPNVYTVVVAVTMISILLVSFFTGKTRGGSLVYGFRTAFISLAVFSVLRLVVGGI